MRVGYEGENETGSPAVWLPAIPEGSRPGSFRPRSFSSPGEDLLPGHRRQPVRVATIDAGGKLESAVAGGNGKLYVNGKEKKEIIGVDTATKMPIGRSQIATSPHGLAIDPEAHRLFSSCKNNVLVVVDADTGAIVATLPIGAGSDAAAFDPKRKLIFSSNGDGTLSVIADNQARRAHDGTRSREWATLLGSSRYDDQSFGGSLRFEAPLCRYTWFDRIVVS